MILEEGIHVRLYRPWAIKEYSVINEWIHMCDNAVWDYNGGKTYLDGKIYYHMILFDSEEDLLAFKLKFGL